MERAVPWRQLLRSANGHALLIAKIENPELDVDAYEQEVHLMVDELKQRVGSVKGEDLKRELDRFFFEMRGFHGSKFEYYHRSNSYLNEVIDDREGLPITLAVLYMALAEPLGLAMEGVGLPGHFVVRWKRVDAEPTYIDVFDQGRAMTPAEVQEIIEKGTDEPAPVESFNASKGGIVDRILFNVLRASQEERNIAAMKRTLSALIAIDPRREGLASKADVWLRVRPGADGALALSLTSELMRMEAYDPDFVRGWTTAPALVRRDTGRSARRSTIRDTTAVAASAMPASTMAPISAERPVSS